MGIRIRKDIKKWLLNKVLNDVEKTIIYESLDDKYSIVFTSKNETKEDFLKDIIQLKDLIKVKKTMYYNL